MIKITFSIIIPTFNRANLLKTALQSFVDQEYQNFEVLVIDDGGCDNSREIVKALNDNRFKYFWKPNEERGAARNYGTAKALGAYINYFDSDDIAYPNHLRVAQETITALNNPEVFHLGYQYIQSSGEVIKKFDGYKGDILNYAVKIKLISPISLFMRTDIAQKIPFVENKHLAASEDALQLCQLAARYKLNYNNIITSALIQHDERSMSTANVQKILLRKDLMIKYLKGDSIFMKKFGNYLPNIESEFYYMLTLASLSQHHYNDAKLYFKKYFRLSGYRIFNVRNLVFFRNYIIRLY